MEHSLDLVMEILWIITILLSLKFAFLKEKKLITQDYLNENELNSFWQNIEIVKQKSFILRGNITNM